MSTLLAGFNVFPPPERSYCTSILRHKRICLGCLAGFRITKRNKVEEASDLRKAQNFRRVSALESEKKIMTESS